MLVEPGVQFKPVENNLVERCSSNKAMIAFRGRLLERQPIGAQTIVVDMGEVVLGAIPVRNSHAALNE